jgi:hypothetical protein
VLILTAAVGAVISLTAKQLSRTMPTETMEPSDEMIALLKEIRDAQREQIAEYKAATQRSIELQQRAVSRAENIGKVYRVALMISAILIVGIIILIAYLMTFLTRR